MNVSSHIEITLSSLKKLWWAAFIPIILDLRYLLTYVYVFKTEYLGNNDIFQIKLGFISSPPSISFFFNDFSYAIFGYNETVGHQGLLNRNLDSLLFFQLLGMVLIVSLLKSFYFNFLNQVSKDSTLNIKDVLNTTNKHWHKFLILESIAILVILHSTLSVFIYGFISIIFLYVQYSIVVDDLSILKSLERSAIILFSNFWRTIKLGISLGLLISIFSFIVLSLGRQGTSGIFAAIVITAFLGVVSNKVVMEVYRGFSQKLKEA